MPKSHNEISAAGWARLDPSAAAAGEVFGKAYDIAMQIVALREKAGLTQVELAERCGISQADISRNGPFALLGPVRSAGPGRVSVVEQPTPTCVDAVRPGAPPWSVARGWSRSWTSTAPAAQ